MKFADRLQNIEASAIREVFRLLGQPGIISFAGGFPDAALFDVQGLEQSARQALGTLSATALQYGPTEGYGPLREQIAAALVAEGAQVEGAQVLVTTGSLQALDLLGKVMLSPGDTVLVEGPTFLSTIQCCKLYGAEVISLPIDEEGMQPQLLEQAIVQHRPRMIYLIPNFGNPSGALLGLERRRRILELAARYQVLLVEDNPYGELYFDQPPPPTLLALSAEVPGSREWLVYCGSFSKVVSPGLRLGWMVAPPPLLAQAGMCKQFSDANSSMLAQVTLSQYLQSGRLPAALAHLRQVYAGRAQLMGEQLRQTFGAALAFTAPKGGMFVWARLTGADGAQAEAVPFLARAVARGVAAVPGVAFFADSPDPASFRMSFATAADDAIIEGVKRLSLAL